MKLNRLFQFFGAYFHQDWAHEVGSQNPGDVVRFFVRGESRTNVLAVVEELRQLLAAKLTEERVGEMIQTEFGGNINPYVDGTNWTHWLEHLAELLEKLAEPAT